MHFYTNLCVIPKYLGILLLFIPFLLAAQQNVISISDSLKTEINNKQDSLHKQLNNVNTAGVIIQSKVDSINSKILSNSALSNATDSLRNINKSLPQPLQNDKIEQFNENLDFNQHLPNTESFSDQVDTEVTTEHNLSTGTPTLNKRVGEMGPLDQKEIARFKNYNSHFHVPEDPDKSINRLAGKSEVFNDLKNQTGKVEQNKQLIDQGYSKLEQMNNKEQWQNKGKAEAQQQLNELFSQRQDKISEVQNSLAELKKKYSYVGNSNDLSTAIKKNSLKGKPLSKRLLIGGQFQIHKGIPLAIDFAPTVLYRINKVFKAGVSGSYRFTLPIDSYGRSKQSNIKDAVGISGIIIHDVFKGFFAYAEGGYTGSMININNATNGQDTGGQFRNWQPTAMIGLGKTFSLTSFLEGRTIITYDFLHNKNQLNNSPWNVKFGFFLKDLKFKNKKEATVQEFMRVNQLK